MSEEKKMQEQRMNGEQRAERMKTVINTRFERKRAHTHTRTHQHKLMAV